MKILALAGGVGGAKLAYGLYNQCPPEDLSIVVNTGDDFTYLGLHISPDLDTVCYTLADLANSDTGWGRKDESWQAFEEISKLGGPDWFRLGDKDMATHLERSRRLALGQTLSQITSDFCAAWGIESSVFPMSDDPIATIVDSNEGKLPFQEYFVARTCEPIVKSFEFSGIENAKASAGFLASIKDADLIVICPSNPWVSIDPILFIPGIDEAMQGKAVIAVSPLIGGQAVKGPAAKMYAELGIEPSSESIARHYSKFLSALVIDHVDHDQKRSIESMGIMVLEAKTLMKTLDDRRRLAGEILEYAEKNVHRFPKIQSKEGPGKKL